jgi:hypothetical protein
VVGRARRRGDSTARVRAAWVLALAAVISVAAALPFAAVAPGIAPSPPGPRSALAAAPTVGSIDIVAYQADHGHGWFNMPLGDLPATARAPGLTLDVTSSRVVNRRGGRISSSLVSSYVFVQFGDVKPEDFAAHAATARALFIRSALLSFVDYEGGRVLDWDGRSSEIPMDVRGMIAAANAKNIPVFLELNYSDYVPGPIGAGVDALVKVDNVARTVAYFRGLAAAGLRVDGVTIGDEWDDPSGFGAAKPPSIPDVVRRFIALSKAVKAAFPALKVYAFDSAVGAATGSVDKYWSPFRTIHAAEVKAGVHLLDGFMFRESYAYIDHAGGLLASQRILDDTESLYRNTPVYRYDSRGYPHADADRDELHLIVAKTREILGRTIDIGLTEYLPAGPAQIDESDTSRYADVDFVLHYADVVGIYADLGLALVSTWMFANSTQQAEAYVTTSGERGLGYPVHEQLATSFAGDLLQVRRSVTYDKAKVKAYAARSGERLFVMLLNKDVARERTVRVRAAGRLDLTIRLPKRSYVSLVADATGVTVSGLGG